MYRKSNPLKNKKQQECAHIRVLKLPEEKGFFQEEWKKLEKRYWKKGISSSFFRKKVEKIKTHRVHCTAVTKTTEFLLKISFTQVDPHTLQGSKLLSVPPKLGKYSETKVGQITIHLFIFSTYKRLT